MQHRCVCVPRCHLNPCWLGCSTLCLCHILYTRLETIPAHSFRIFLNKEIGLILDRSFTHLIFGYSVISLSCQNCGTEWCFHIMFKSSNTVIVVVSFHLFIWLFVTPDSPWLLSFVSIHLVLLNSS